MKEGDGISLRPWFWGQWGRCLDLYDFLSITNNILYLMYCNQNIFVGPLANRKYNAE